MLSSVRAADEPQWLAEIERIRQIEDVAAAQQAAQQLAKQLPERRSAQLQYRWLSLQLALDQLSNDPEALRRDIDAMLALAQTSDLIEARVEGLLFRADQLKNAGKPAQALQELRDALVLLDRIDDQRLLYNSHNRAAILYADLGDFENALTHHLKALPIAEQSGDKRRPRELLTLNNLGSLYLRLRQPEKALDHLQRAMPLAIAANDRSMQTSLNTNLGYALSSLGRNAEAVKAYQQALRLARERSDAKSESIALVNLSDEALQRQAYSEAADYARSALVIAQRVGDISNEGVAHANIGIALAGQGLSKQGLQSLQTSLQIFQRIGDQATEDLVLTEIVKVTEQLALPAESITALRRQLEIREQMFSSDRQRAISELQEQFDAKARQKQIELLERENELQAAEIDKRRLYQWIGGLVTLVIVLATTVVLMSYRRMRDVNQQLQVANAKLADQSIRDPLTGLFNRRSFQLAMERRRSESERRSQHDNTVDAFILLDVDHFKRINDGFGHAAGDIVLIEIAARLSKVMRDRDMVLRWGGEEFLLYLRGSSVDALHDVVARVLATIANTPVTFDGKTIVVTASAGFVPLPFAGLAETQFGWEKAVQLADVALYLGKSRGRNRAYGVLAVHGDYQELAPLLEQNLAQAIRHHQVSAVEVLGPGASAATDDA